MPHLLHLDAAARRINSTSRAVAVTYRAVWDQLDRDGTVTYRDLAFEPMPHLTHATEAYEVDEAEWSPAQREGKAAQHALVDEFLAADAYLLSMPMYNYGVPSTVKAWLDQILLAGRVFGSNPPVAGRPITVIVVSGGFFDADSGQADWDFARPFLEKTFVNVLEMDLTLILVEGTLLDDDEGKARCAASTAAAHEVARAAARRAYEAVASAMDVAP